MTTEQTAQPEFQNTLYTNDNLFVLRRLDSESVDLIYLDPPFNSKREYDAPTGSLAEGASFNDIWKWDEDVDEKELADMIPNHPKLVQFILSIGTFHSKPMQAYIFYMAQRIVELHRILKPTGSIYYHCDPTAGHFVKIMLDCVFGEKNFRNEIVWCYKFGGRGKRDFARKHDLIYRYAKNVNDYYFNTEDILVPYESEMAKWSYEQGLKKELPAGKIPEDWWDIPTINAMANYRTGYPTQKPPELLERIIKSSCPPNGVVLDPFCGCGTTCVVAKHLGINWIGIDKSATTPNTIRWIYENKYGEGMLYKEDYVVRKDLPIRHDLRIENLEDKLTKKEIKERLYKQQNCKCNGCGNPFPITALEIDHIFPKSRGGEDNYENFQLLCGWCNRVKGNRDMKYLNAKIKANMHLLEFDLPKEKD